MGVEEMDGEDEAGSQERLIRVDDRGNIDYPSWQKDSEVLWKPEHQS